MTPPSLLFAAVALLPAISAPADGAPQLSAAAAVMVGLCNGGNITVPLGSGAPPATPPCCVAKGCCSGAKRKRIDRKQ